MTFHSVPLVSFDMASLGQQIRAARERLGLTQTDLGRAVGVSRNAVSLWESDKNGPTLDTMLKVCGTS